MLLRFRGSSVATGRLFSSSYGAAKVASTSAVALVADKSNSRREAICNTKKAPFGSPKASGLDIYKNATLGRRVFFCLGENFCNALTVVREWKKECRSVSKSELNRIISELRRLKRYDQALPICDWMAEERSFELQPGDFAVHLDLVAKVHGLKDAEDFFNCMPARMRYEEYTCTTLLCIYIQNKEAAKTEALVKKMAEHGLLRKPKPYNRMISAYISAGQFDMALKMIKQLKNNVRPNTASYNQWLRVCSYLGDVKTAETALAEMKWRKVKRDWLTYSTLSGLYIKKNLIEKAAHSLKGLEFKATREHRIAYSCLLSMHASIGNRGEIFRIWAQIKSDFGAFFKSEYAVMMRSLLKLKMYDKAEELYSEWASSPESGNCKVPNILLEDYINRRGMEAAEGFYNSMVRGGIKPTFTTWELMTWGYLKEKKSKKAVHCFNNALRMLKVWKPDKNLLRELFNSLEEVGDVQGAEEAMTTLRGVGQVNTEIYNWVLKTYAKAGKSEPKMIERMRRDKVKMDEETRRLIE